MSGAPVALQLLLGFLAGSAAPATVPAPLQAQLQHVLDLVAEDPRQPLWIVSASRRRIVAIGRVENLFLAGLEGSHALRQSGHASDLRELLVAGWLADDVDQAGLAENGGQVDIFLVAVGFPPPSLEEFADVRLLAEDDFAGLAQTEIEVLADEETFIAGINLEDEEHLADLPLILPLVGFVMRSQVDQAEHVAGVIAGRALIVLAALVRRLALECRHRDTLSETGTLENTGPTLARLLEKERLERSRSCNGNYCALAPSPHRR